MRLVNRDDQATLTVVSQTKLDTTDTVYNFTVDEFHTYHIGEFGTWVHNDCYVLQSGGNTLSSNAAKVLNEAFGTNYSRREIGRALEELKKYEGLPPNHHGKIMSNGDYTDASGNFIGNIGDFLQ